MGAILRVVGSWGLVMAAVAGVFAAADRLPALILGSAHGARVYETVEEAERALGGRLWIPAYFPDTLAWPPTRIQAVPGSPPVVAVHLSARDGTADALVVCQSLGAPGQPGAFGAALGRLLPEGEVMTATAVDVNGRSARLSRVLAAGGQLVHDLGWDEGGRSIVLRSAGPVDQLLLMANSLGGPR